MRIILPLVVVLGIVSLSAPVQAKFGLPDIPKKAKTEIPETGAGGKIKETLDSIDKIEANFKLSKETLNDATITLKEIARNHSAIKELALQQEELDREMSAVMKAEEKANKKEKKELEAKREALSAKKIELNKREMSFWSDEKNVAEIKKQSLSTEQRKKLLDLGLNLGVATLANKSVIDEAERIVEAIPNVSKNVKDEIKNPMEAARTTKRLTEAPSTLNEIRKDAVESAERLVIFSKAVKMLTTE